MESPCFFAHQKSETCATMDGASNPGIGRGRGSLLLDMVKKKQAAVGSTDDSSEQSAGPLTSPEQPTRIESAPSVTSSGMGSSICFGRGNLLQFAQKSQSPQPSQTPSPLPLSSGRGSLLSFAQKFSDSGGLNSPSSVGESVHAVPKLTTSGDGAGVLGPLSQLTMDDRSQGTTDSEPISRQGETGKRVEMTANYIDLKVEHGKGLFRYEVKFSPEIDSVSLRRKLLNQHAETFGNTRTFDGALLYLPSKLPQSQTVYKSLHPADGSSVNVTLIYQAQMKLSDSIHFFNNLLGRVMRALSLVRIGRDNYNPRCAHAVPQHKMELWPGYVTAIDEYEGGLKLNINASHRVMRTDTVRDLLGEIQKNTRSDFRAAVTAEILGLTVLTRYNNRTYRIDDIDWDKNPLFSFDRKGEKVVVQDYYKSHWNIEIKDLHQPLLVNRRKEKTSTGETKEVVSLLIPELCYLSGLTDKLRSDFRVMRDLASVTQVGPEARRNVILRFVQDVKNTPVANDILEGWGLRMAENTTRFEGRVLPPEILTFGQERTFKSEKADWGGAVVKNPMLRTPHMRCWCILATDRDARTAGEFVSMLRRVGRNMTMEITEPIYIKLQNDRVETYLSEIRKVINPNLEMVVAVCPTNRNDRYAAIKKLCCVEAPVRSQVIVTKTISRSDKLKSVSEKIALQLNCKLGGALWALEIPFKNCMICGVDVYHAGPGEKSKGSVAAFVASTDKSLTSWYSRICLQRPNQELVDLLKICLVAAIKAYSKINGCNPQRIFIYRDGVGDGQLDIVANYEVKQLLDAFTSIDSTYQPKLTFIVVQKRINTRLLAVVRGRMENPSPGTIVDSMVTRRNWYDFFLVPQTSHQGTVSPTHYIVIYDAAEMKADYIQRLSFKLCHLYYNWPGTVRVPAPCQYAHKLAYLVGQSIGTQPSDSLANSLYYL
ncbi:piwi-like protein Ago3 isoform X2 [Venturia canescens]|uniref:piwi-like protein Ago3 isoform X2 n=1 Tax=Venturia canescens TaxID=32260 RepID=UPI001C9C966D|nr:piwi-like protein Ago3 isoform X2 [Venturia canescens]